MPMPSATEPKDAWRAWARRVRERIDPEPWANGIEAQLLESPVLDNARRIASYLAFGTEVDLHQVHAQFSEQIVIPRIDPTASAMTFHPLGSPLEELRIGLRQPSPTADAIPADEIDVVLVPGLAFDARGYRLGYGGGYYDRWLSTHAKSKVVIGIGHTLLLIDALPRGPHDRAMGMIATEDALVVIQ